VRAGGPIHVTAPKPRRAHDGFVLHRTRALDPADVALVGGIATTSVHRTLVDLADVLTEKRLADAVNEAEVKRVFDLQQLRAAQARVPGRRGRHRLDRVLEAYTQQPFTRSEAEKALKELCEDFAIPTPEFNATRAGRELDALWSEAGLAIEVDGRETHGTIRAFYADRARDRALAVERIQVLRVTWPDLTTGRASLAVQIKALLPRR
jgi:very-short-patch-repair endonuclease